MPVAGAGVLLRDVHAAALASGQLYPPDPTETGASIGGNIACNASGSRSFRYGATGAWVERLRVVLADGRILDVGRGEPIDFEPGTVPLPAVTKNTAGYLLRPGMDWVDLFMGSEGTLGVVTEATLRLTAGAQSCARRSGVLPQRRRGIERGGAMAHHSLAAHAGVLRPALARVVAHAFSGDSGGGARGDPVRSGDAVGGRSGDRPWLERLEGTGALVEDSWFATTANDRERFRRFRHALPELVNDAVRRSGAMKMNTDFAVPLVRNREMLAYYRQRLEEEFPGRYVIFGHIGDAHVHVNVFSDPADPRRAADADCGICPAGGGDRGHGLGGARSREAEGSPAGAAVRAGVFGGDARGEAAPRSGGHTGTGHDGRGVGRDSVGWNRLRAGIIKEAFERRILGFPGRRRLLSVCRNDPRCGCRMWSGQGEGSLAFCALEF